MLLIAQTAVLGQYFSKIFLEIKVTQWSFRKRTQIPFRAYCWHCLRSLRDGILDSCPSHYSKFFSCIINQRTRATLIPITLQNSLPSFVQNWAASLLSPNGSLGCFGCMAINGQPTWPAILHLPGLICGPESYFKMVNGQSNLMISPRFSK